MEKEFQADRLKVKICSSREELGKRAAKDISDAILKLLARKSEINIIFAAAPSQNEVLEQLANEDRIDYSRINAFHMDEYIGLPKDAPQRFGNYLCAHLFDRCNFKSVHLINGLAENIEEECKRYGDLLTRHPADIVCMGIGENGHIAFNDPSSADFSDQKIIKAVTLEEICRRQQVHDGCFSSLADVPTQALTLTVPTLFHADYHFCMVPAKTKAQAVHDTIHGPIGEHCPASILRRAQNAVLYLDPDSSALLK